MRIHSSEVVAILLGTNMKSQIHSSQVVNFFFDLEKHVIILVLLVLLSTSIKHNFMAFA